MNICGNIFVDKTFKSYILKCIFCLKDVEIQQFKEFIQHIQDFHGTNDEEPIIDIYENTFKENISVEEIKAESDVENVKIKTSGVTSITNDNDMINNALNKGETEGSLSDSTGRIENDESGPENSSDVTESSSDSDYEAELNVHNKLCISLHCSKPCTKHFIEAIKQHPCLWQPTHPEYNKRKPVAAAFTEVKKEMHQKTNNTMTDRAMRNALRKIISQYKALIKKEDENNSDVIQENRDLCAFLSDAPAVEDIDEVVDRCRSILNFAKVNQETVAFIETLQQFPSLYDTQHADYSNQNLRKQSISDMLQIFKSQHEIEITDDQLQASIRKLHTWYDKLCNRIKKQSKFTKIQKVYMEKCKYLPKRQAHSKMNCEECDKIFFSETALKTHLYKVHKKGELPFKCPDCDRSFGQKCTLITHQQRSHIGRKFQCEHCERRFAVLIDLQRHLRTHSDQKPFVCEQCGKAFRCKTHLGYHVTAMHTKIRAYKCTMCPKDFLKPVHLRDHIKAHLNIRDKICETCGKGFTNCHSLIRHRQIHSDVKKFACKLCDAKFHQFVGLNSHMKRTHNVVKNKAAS